MSKTEIILLKYVEGLGAEGDFAQVAPGYYRNYLGPQGLALLSNRSNKKQIDALKARKAERERRDMEAAQNIQNRLNNMHLAIAVRTGESGKKLFGTVNAHTLIKRLKEDGFDFHAKQFHWGEPIKALGKYTVPLKLCYNLTHDLHFEVVSENPIELQKEEQEEEKPSKKRYAKA